MHAQMCLCLPEGSQGVSGEVLVARIHGTFTCQEACDV